MLTYDGSNSQSKTTLQTEIKQAVHDFMDYNVVLKFATIPPISLFNVANFYSHNFSEPEINLIQYQPQKLETLPRLTIPIKEHIFLT